MDFHEQQAMAIPATKTAGKMSLFPVGEGASVDSVFNMGSLDEVAKTQGVGDGMVESINKGGGALGGTMDELGGQVVSHLGAPQAEGDNIKLEQTVAGDLNNLKAPHVQGDLQLDKGVGMGKGA